MVLTTIPPELLLCIISFLNSYDVERLAQTFNRQLYSVCLPAIEGRIAKRRNATRMSARFNPYFRDERTASSPNAVVQGQRFRAMPNLDYLELNGDLRWLVSPSKAVMKRSNGSWHTINDPPSEELLTKIQQQAQQFGLILPEGFLNFFRSEELIRRMPWTHQYLTLPESGILKCPAAVDGGAGGFILRFYAQTVNCLVWSLYLETGTDKGHCVLGTGWDPHLYYEEYSGPPMTCSTVAVQPSTVHDLQEGSQDGVGTADLNPKDTFISATSFEEFIANCYFVHNLTYTSELKQRATEDLEEFARNCYGISARNYMDIYLLWIGAKRGGKKEMSNILQRSTLSPEMRLGWLDMDLQLQGNR